MDEFNWNSRAKQLTVYLDGRQVARFVGDDFAQFENIGAIIQEAMDKKPDIKLPAEIEEIDVKIAELQKRKDDLLGREEKSL